MRFVQGLAAAAGTFGTLNACYPNFRIAARYFFSFDISTIDTALNPATHLSDTGNNWRTVSTNFKAHGQAPSEKKSGKGPPEIKVDKLTFRYGTSGPLVLREVSFTVRPGEQIAVLGPSGSGKSTLLALVMGVFEPSGGTLQIQGKNPTDYFADGRSNQLGYVGAEPFLIAGSIRENMLYGISDKTPDDDLLNALEAAQLRDWLQGVTNGLDYVISENGEGMSSGQKQRLSLARALLRKPDLLILDEVSANLDPKTEAEIAHTIRNLEGRCTTLIVSHREGLVSGIRNRITLTATKRTVKAYQLHQKKGVE